MEKPELDEKITEVSKAILSYCMARTSNQYDAEDLAQEIILEIYRSSANIRDDRAFYGFMWAVAGNVYRQWCRKSKCDSCGELPEDLADNGNDLSEMWEEDSDIELLRRELTLLALKYRRAVILYYLENNSCAQIALKLSVTESMVKYLLFKSRQIVKDGMNMERKLGEQSYNPKRMGIRFWGEHNHYAHVCDSVAAQNILFACYNDKLTAEQISLEIGVALPYMEDDLRRLAEYGLLEKDGNRYYTNIVIFTREFEREADARILEFAKRIADRINRELEEKEQVIRNIGFYGADMDRNSFVWQMACILLRQAIMEEFENRAELHYPVDKFGEACFVWGQEQDESNGASNNFGFGNCTVSNKIGDRIFFMDFRVNGKKIGNVFFNRRDYTNVLLELAGGKTEGYGENDMAALADLVKWGIVRNDNGKLCPNMPVLTEGQQAKLMEIFEDITEEIAVQAEELREGVAGILRNHVPAYLKKTAKDLAYFKVQGDSISKSMEILYREKYLLPAESGFMLPTTYAVKVSKDF